MDTKHKKVKQSILRQADRLRLPVSDHSRKSSVDKSIELAAKANRLNIDFSRHDSKSVVDSSHDVLAHVNSKPNIPNSVSSEFDVPNHTLSRMKTKPFVSSMIRQLVASVATNGHEVSGGKMTKTRIEPKGVENEPKVDESEPVIVENRPIVDESEPIVTESISSVDKTKEDEVTDSGSTTKIEKQTTSEYLMKVISDDPPLRRSTRKSKTESSKGETVPNKRKKAGDRRKITKRKRDGTPPIEVVKKVTRKRAEKKSVKQTEDSTIKQESERPVTPTKENTTKQESVRNPKEEVSVEKTDTSKQEVKGDTDQTQVNLTEKTSVVVPTGTEPADPTKNVAIESVKESAISVEHKVKKRKSHKKHRDHQKKSKKHKTHGLTDIASPILSPKQVIEDTKKQESQPSWLWKIVKNIF